MQWIRQPDVGVPGGAWHLACEAGGGARAFRARDQAFGVFTEQQARGDEPGGGLLHALDVTGVVAVALRERKARIR